MKRHMLKINIPRGFVAFSAVVLLLAVTAVSPVSASSCATNPDLQSCSATYGVGETFFGSGGQLQTCSAAGSSTYQCAKTSAGELTVGNTKGTAYQAQTGFNTNRQPYIEMSITKSTVNLGTVTPTTTGADTAVFKVKSYLASGYQVQIFGTAPTNSGHAVTAMAGGTSAAGTEQFGINLAVNTTPAIGTAPVQDRDGSGGGTAFGYGAVATSPVNYNIANHFQYTSGDKIATSSQSSGWTTYTISYIMNVSNVTPGGTYTTTQSIVATSTF